MKVNSKLLINSLRTNPSHRPSAAPQDLQQHKDENFGNFPTLINLNFDSVVEEPRVENLSSFL